MITVEHIPTWTYFLDAIGAAGILVGGYVASRSVYSRENAKDAAQLIETQKAMREVLKEELEKERSERIALKTQLDQMQGQLDTYRKLQTLDPKVITQLLTTQNKILSAIQGLSDGR